VPLTVHKLRPVPQRLDASRALCIDLSHLMFRTIKPYLDHGRHTLSEFRLQALH
jgi:hypothetical protein